MQPTHNWTKQPTQNWTKRSILEIVSKTFIFSHSKTSQFTWISWPWPYRNGYNLIWPDNDRKYLCNGITISILGLGKLRWQGNPLYKVQRFIRFLWFSRRTPKSAKTKSPIINNPGLTNGDGRQTTLSRRIICIDQTCTWRFRRIRSSPCTNGR